MELYELLEKTYGNDTPILLSEIKIPSYTAVGLRQSLSRLTKKGTVARFASGIFYLPSDTIIGKSILSARKVVEKKYITDGINVYGFYSGLTFENTLSLTTQVPNINEVVTNSVSSRTRTVTIKNLKVQLRKCPVEITSENANYLQLIDFIYRYDTQKLTADNKAKIMKYICDKKINKYEIISLLLKFPANASKKFIESGILDEFA